MITGVYEAVLYSDDIEAAVAFYRDVLGFTVGMQVPDASPLVFAGMQSGDIEIFLNSAEAALQQHLKDVQTVKQNSGKPFAKAAELEKKKARLKQLHDELAPPVEVTVATPAEQEVANRAATKQSPSTRGRRGRRANRYGAD